MIFKDRFDAGKQLAKKLHAFQNSRATIVALARGGVPVGYEIAQMLQLPMHVLIIRKIGLPHNPEYGIGALAPDHTLYIDKSLIRESQISAKQIIDTIQQEMGVLLARQKLYQAYNNPINIQGKTVILTDDGLATGVTAITAILWLKKQKVAKIILAIPGAPVDILLLIERMVDKVICLDIRKKFKAVSNLYETFEQISDEEVVGLLKELKRMFLSDVFS